MDGVEVAVRTVTPVGPESVAISFESPSGFDANPGQFVQLSARIDDEVVKRYFTLSSSQVTDTFEITVEVDPSGSLTPWLAAREPGDVVDLSGPFGDVYYEGEPTVVVLAAGPGIGPAVGIAERASDEGAAVAIVYPADATVQRERLTALAHRGVSIYRATDSLEAPTRDALETVGGTVFVYGFAPFVRDAIAAMEAAGYDPEDAKIESFGPAP